MRDFKINTYSCHRRTGINDDELQIIINNNLIISIIEDPFRILVERFDLLCPNSLLYVLRTPWILIDWTRQGVGFFPRIWMLYIYLQDGQMNFKIRNKKISFSTQWIPGYTTVHVPVEYYTQINNFTTLFYTNPERYEQFCHFISTTQLL